MTYDDDQDDWQPAPERDGLVVSLLAYVALVSTGCFGLLVYVAQQVATP